jgi:hypothetical protein
LNAPGPCVVEVHPDGGIRLTTPSGEQGLASLQTTRDWIAEANRAGAPVRLCGSLGASSAAPVLDEVRRLATSLEEQQTDPAPWAMGHTSVQTAAFNGLTEQLSDLLDRGASPNIGRWRSTPYRLAMQRGHTEALVALGDAGARVPRGLEPPAALPNGVVLRAYAPRFLWWITVPFVVLAAAVAVAGAPAIAPALVLVPLIAVGAVHVLLGNTKCAFDGPYVARRRGRGWQGPVVLRELDALGVSPPGPVRSPIIWVLGQRQAGDAPNVYSRRTFNREQLAALERTPGLRFVPIYAARGFLSPGFERLLARHVDRASVIVGDFAEERVWPGATPAYGM